MPMLGTGGPLSQAGAITMAGSCGVRPAPWAWRATRGSHSRVAVACPGGDGRRLPAPGHTVRLDALVGAPVEPSPGRARAMHVSLGIKPVGSSKSVWLAPLPGALGRRRVDGRGSPSVAGPRRLPWRLLTAPRGYQGPAIRRQWQTVGQEGRTIRRE